MKDITPTSTPFRSGPLDGEIDKVGPSSDELQMALIHVVQSVAGRGQDHAVFSLPGIGWRITVENLKAVDAADVGDGKK